MLEVELYCKRANIRGGFNFAMFAVDDFSAKLKPPRSFYNTSVYSYLLLHVHLKIQNPRNLNNRERSPSGKPRNFSTAKLKPFTVLWVTTYIVAQIFTYLQWYRKDEIFLFGTFWHKSFFKFLWYHKVFAHQNISLFTQIVYKYMCIGILNAIMLWISDKHCLRSPA